MVNINGLHHTSLTLYELNCLVSETISNNLCREYWVEAELSEVREVRGHCYMELVQKDLAGNTPVARASAKCWKNRWIYVSQIFKKVTGQVLHSGMKVLLNVRADFHPAFGFSWIVSDIDPTYTLGDMAQKRIDIIRKLKNEGVFDLQKGLKISSFANSIAVISTDNAAGYGDFFNQLQSNDYCFKFSIRLFPAIMQGEKVEQSVIDALEKIYEDVDKFDVVVITRGGGATSDMSGFDSLSLAENVANFPLPIITGIGHERDESIIDMVSNTTVKTPTAAAALLIENLIATNGHIDDIQKNIVDFVTNRMRTEHTRIDNLAQKIPLLFSVVKSKNLAILEHLSLTMAIASKNIIDSKNRRFDILCNRLCPTIELRMSQEHSRLKLLEHHLSSLDPHKLLKRGYSITLKDGHSITSFSTLKKDDVITTILDKGTIKSITYEINDTNIL
jgi:exodeoxyribonuclease VII large subunit